MKSLSPKYLLTTLWMLFTVACSQSNESDKSGHATLTVQIAPRSYTTRAATPGDGNIYDGGGMEDLTLVLVNPNGRVAAIERIEGLTGEQMKRTEVQFEHLDIGNYTLNAYANTLRSYLGEAEELLATLQVGESFDADALFDTLSGTDAPETSDEKPLLLTATQQIAIQMGQTTTSVILSRPVVRFEVVMHNHSNYEITVTDVTPSPFNPSTSYLLPHNGAIPASATYRNLPTYDHYTGGVDIVAAPDSEQTIYRTEIFENQAPSYTLSLTVETTTTVYDYSTTNVNYISANTQYALKNRSTGNYLVDNGGVMSVVSSLNSAPSLEHALWTFSGTSSGYLTNVATGNRYYRSTSSSTSGSNLTFSRNNGYYRIYYNSYYLRDNSGALIFSSGSSQTRDWQVQRVTTNTSTAVVPHTVSDQQLYVVDEQSGSVRAMSEQLRNQYIRVMINAYYDEISGLFNFEVKPWVEKNEEVEFN